MPEEYLNIFKKYGFVSNSENNWDIIKQINQPGQTIVINGQQMQQPGKTFSINYHIEFLGEGLIDNNIALQFNFQLKINNDIKLEYGEIFENDTEYFEKRLNEFLSKI